VRVKSAHKKDIEGKYMGKKRLRRRSIGTGGAGLGERRRVRVQRNLEAEIAKEPKAGRNHEKVIRASLESIALQEVDSYAVGKRQGKKNNNNEKEEKGRPCMTRRVDSYVDAGAPWGP